MSYGIYKKMAFKHHITKKFVKLYLTCCMSSSTSTFNKIVTLCKRNSILTFEKMENKIVNVRYGPLGYLLKRNIYKEWLNSFVNHNEASIFPIVIEEPHNPLFNPNSNQSELFMHDILEQYEATLPLVSHHLPFGLALKSKYVKTATTNKQNEKEENAQNSSNSEDNEILSVLWDLQQWTCKTMAFFCDPKKAMHWFYYWQRQRYLWWRKLSAMPSYFSFSEIIQTSNDDQSVCVQTEYPWGIQKLETVRVFGNARLKTLFGNSPLAIRKENESVQPGLILCRTDLDLAVFTYICNSFNEKWFDGKLTGVLRLHYKLSPYKVSVAINGVNKNCLKKLTEISNRLVKELKRKAVSVLPNLNFKSDLPIQSQFERFDEMGIPYTIVLYENSLITGIAGLRNRDTTLQEQVHITELTSKIITYLVMDIKIDKIR